MKTVEERFFRHVDKDGPEHPWLGRCWTWTAARIKGYGYFRLLAGRNILAHRFSYLLHSGYTVLTIDHCCRNKSCVNPLHLLACTHVDNTRRNNAYRHTCIRGHEFSKQN